MVKRFRKITVLPVRFDSGRISEENCQHRTRLLSAFSIYTSYMPSAFAKFVRTNIYSNIKINVNV